jgi:hypothetical protein
MAAYNKLAAALRQSEQILVLLVARVHMCALL